MFERILVPLDGSDLAERVLPHVEELAKQFNAEITLLRAITPLAKLTLQQATGLMGLPDAPPDIAAEILGAERAAAEAYLAAMKDRLQQQGLNVTTVMMERDSAQAILECAKEREVSLIAMCTHGRGGLGRLVFGSVTDEVLRHERNVPMLLIHGSD